MTSRERFVRMYQHREADRIPIIDAPWAATVERWHREGMPKDVGYVDFFGLDRVAGISCDNSPRYTERVIEEDEDSITKFTVWGGTMRNWKHSASTPEFLDFTVKDPDSWAKARQRMTPSDDRIRWDALRSEYPRWREQGYWVRANLWFGFDVTHAWFVGTERLLMAMATDPEWVMDMFNHFLDVHLALFDRVWDAGYRFDCIQWPDDMGYRQHTFFSLKMYRDLLKPVHRRAIEWAHAKGVPAHLHSCGNITPFVPDLLDIGLDGLNPLEVKAGMDPLALKREHGGRLLLHGGINARLWDKPDMIRGEMERVVPRLKEGGGYVFSSDHSVPSSVGLEDFRRIVDLAKMLGRY
jgi:uroporphyrinogen decarboxylase